MKRAALHFTLGLSALLLLLAAGPADATTITIMNANIGLVGFNDPTPVAPVAGNAGTTLGQQRLNVFLAAAAYWSNRLASSVPITVSAEMIPLSCTAQSALLGRAGPTNAYSDFPNVPRPATWYPSALANTLAGFDVDSSAEEIDAQFSTNLDNNPACLGGIHWDYSIGGTAPAHTLPFYQTVLHELAHGLGFITFVDLTTGALEQGQDDVFELFLEDHSTGKTWGQMTNLERKNSAKDTGDLHWTGPHVVAASSVLSAGRHPSGHVRMYAPNPLALGSSVAHWDTVLTPDELLEPFATLSPKDELTTHLLNDIGWSLQPPPPCVTGADTACLQSGRFEVKVDWETSANTGAGQVMSFGGPRAETDESVFWWFFSPTNFEMGVKVLDACSLTNTFWVFTSGLTDQGWTVHVRDTTTGATQVYSNALGHLSSTFADTSAFSCP
ncbi:MAG TPA: hypothetical protein VLV54_16270 [Thermoanaerobaculia bacterium]|nr:hypothetical protein [Thermoanaerobaculia bacterium]